MLRGHFEQAHLCGAEERRKKDGTEYSVSAASDSANNQEAQGKGLQVTTRSGPGVCLELPRESISGKQADLELKESTELTTSSEWKPHSQGC